MVWLKHSSSQVKQLKDFATELEEFGTAARPGPIDLHRDRALDSPRARRHDDNAVTHIDGLLCAIGRREVLRNIFYM